MSSIRKDFRLRGNICSSWNMLKALIFEYLQNKGEFTPKALARVFYNSQERIEKALKELVLERKVYAHWDGHYGAAKYTPLIQPLVHNPSR